MSWAKNTFFQIERLTYALTEESLCEDQNLPVKNPNGSGWDTCRIEIPNKQMSVALKNVEYQEMFDTMSKKRTYNFRLIDGALMVMLYDFSKDVLLRHTLAYYPNPDLLSFQENEVMYEEDSIYLDMIDKQRVIVPIRFDYDLDAYKDVEHPKAHLTLGQFKNCRIPVSRPLMPCQFVHFILRNFYNHKYVEIRNKLINDDMCYDETISSNEKKIVHISVE